MTYRLAVFDMAGTTVSNSDLVVEALLQTLQAHGYQARPEQARALMGYPKPQAIRILLGEGSAAAADPALVESLHREFIGSMLHSYRSSPEVAPMPAAEDCFAALRGRGIKVALNTAFSRDIAQAIVERFGWFERGAIDDLIATDEVPAGRPAPDMIRALMARHGIADPGAVLKVGDTEVDVKEGRNAGCGLVVAVTTGAYDRASLQAYAPDHILDSLAQLPPLL
jgi:phosphonatase-like hydrolase